MTKTITKEKLALIFILLCAAALRLAWVDWTLPNKFHTATYNCDESTALTALQTMDPSKLNFNPVNEKNPFALSQGTFNLYTYGALLKLLSLVKYLTLIPNKDFYYENPEEMGKLYMSGRLLSVFYGLLSVFAVFVLGKRMYGSDAGLLAALFTAIMPAHVVYSRYIIMNVPGTFWIIFTFIFLKKIIDGGSARDYIFAGVGSGLAVATRYSGVPLAGMPLAAHLMSAGPLEKKKLLCLAYAAALLSFFIGTPYTFLAFPDFMKAMHAVSGVASAGAGLSFFEHLAILGDMMSSALGLPLLLASLAGLAAAAARRTKYDMLLSAWIVLLLAFFYRAGVSSHPGRMLPALPFMAILAAAPLSRVWERKPWIVRVTLAAVAAHAVIFYSAYFGLLSRPDVRDTASEWIIGNIKPGASIGLVREPSWFTPGVIDRKYRHPDHAGLPDYKFVPLRGKDWRAYCGYDLLCEAKPDFVIASDWEIESLTEAEFLKALKNCGYHETVKLANSFPVLGFDIAGTHPDMFYMPKYISVFKKTSATGLTAAEKAHP